MNGSRNKDKAKTVLVREFAGTTDHKATWICPPPLIVRANRSKIPPYEDQVKKGRASI
mgnify:CR=1 FL=1